MRPRCSSITAPGPYVGLALGLQITLLAQQTVRVRGAPGLRAPLRVEEEAAIVRMQ